MNNEKEKTPYLDRVLMPHGKNGKFIQPMSFAGGTDGKGDPMWYPVLPPEADVQRTPMFFEADFAPGGQFYDRIIYRPAFYTGRFGVQESGLVLPMDFSSILYFNPIFNLPNLVTSVQHNGIPPFMLPAAQNLISTLGGQGVSPLRISDTEEEDDVLHLPNGSGQKMRICNCAISVTALRTIIEGDKHSFEVALRLVRKARMGATTSTVYVPERNLDRLAEYLSSEFPWFSLATETRGAANLLAEHIRDQLDDVPQHTVFRSSGWQELNGQHIFVHGGLQNRDTIFFDCDQAILSDKTLNPTQAYRNAFSILDLGKLEVTLPLCLSTVSASLFRIFEQAGYTPRFCTFLYGLSGSLKTSVANVFYAFYPGEQCASFRDTPAAIDVSIAKHRDRLLVVDDFRPPVIAADGRAMSKTLEHLICLFGDDIAKHRSNTRATATYGERPKGACLITGESVSGSYSSLLRCLLVPISRGDIDGERLRRFQEEPTLWTTNFVHFLPWVGSNWDMLVRKVRENFPAWRRVFEQKVPEPRLVDTGSVLMLTAEIFLEYGCEQQALSAGDLQNYLQLWQGIIDRLLAASTEAAQELDLVVLTKEAILSAKAAGTLKAASNLDCFTAGMDGFFNDGRFWLHPPALDRVLRQYCETTGAVCVSRKAILPELYRRGLIVRDEESGKNSFLKRAPHIPSLGTRPRMIAFVADELFRED